MSKTKRLALERANRELKAAHDKVSATRVKMAEAIELFSKEEGDDARESTG